MSATSVTFSAIFKVLGVAPKIWKGLARAWKGGPSDEDRKAIRAYCKWIDERRVFSMPFTSEVVEACIGSLHGVTEETAKALATVEHPGASASLGAILDAVRGFVDKWGHLQTPRPHHRFEPEWGPRPRIHGEQGVADLPEFFKDLGELRSKVRVFVGMLIELEPKARAKRLRDGGD